MKVVAQYIGKDDPPSSHPYFEYDTHTLKGRYLDENRQPIDDTDYDWTFPNNDVLAWIRHDLMGKQTWKVYCDPALELEEGL